MKRPLLFSFALFAMLALLAFGQRGGGRDEPNPLDEKLPSGKSMRDEIVKADFKKNQEDSVKLALLAAEVRDELSMSDSHVVSVRMLKKLDDMEKLTRGIRGRLKRN